MDYAEASLDIKTSGGDSFVADSTFVVFLMLIGYIIAGSLIEYKQPSCLHETSVAILFGMLVSFIVALAKDDEYLI